MAKTVAAGVGAAMHPFYLIRKGKVIRNDKLKF